MKLKEFVEKVGVQEATIRRRLKDIPGHYVENDKIYFIEGTRYPTKKNKSIKSQYDKYYAILIATNRDEYIDHTYINETKSTFDLYIKVLIDKNLLIKNHTNNPYGANSYQLTLDAAERVSNHNKNKIINLLTTLLNIKNLVY